MNSPFDALLEPSEKKGVHTAPVKLVSASGRYKLGQPERPPIHHDNGHLDAFPRREPTVSDHIQYAKWRAKLDGSEALCSGPTAKLVPACNFEDLSDANAAYRHFLIGAGKDRQLNYERYLANDDAGKKVVPNVLHDFQQHAEIIGKDRLRFSMTGTEYSIGNGGIAPYPATSNWQKAIGAHYLWVSADLSVKADKEGKIHYAADLVFHMEDRYNFNPGATDIATGIPDAENGVFEITGLAHQYTNYATVQRHVEWVEGSWESATSGAPTARQRKPQDNRRLRNKL